MNERGLKTYGRARFRHRVIVTDTWLTDSDSKKNIFGTSSENDSSKQSSLFSISSSSSDRSVPSLNVTEDRVKPKRITRQKKASSVADKENINTKAISQRKTTKTSKFKPSSDNNGESSGTHLTVPKRTLRSSQIHLDSLSHTNLSNISSAHTSTNTSEHIPSPELSSLSSRVLRRRCQKSRYGDSANLKPQQRGTTAKRKRPVKQAVDRFKESSVNFSDFDDYSLIIQENSTDCNKVVHCVETSTPVGKRTRKNFQVENSNISRIEVVISPSSDTCYTSLETPYSVNCRSEGHSRIDNHFESPSLPSVSSQITNNSNIESRNDKECVVLLEKLTDTYIEKQVEPKQDFLKPPKVGQTDKAATCKTPESRVLLDNMTESFIERHTDPGKKFTRSQMSGLNGSESLFSSPGNVCMENLKLITSRLKQISFIDDSDSDVVHGTYENEEDEGEVDEEEDEYDDEVESEEIEEGDEEEEAEEEEEESDADELSVLLEIEDELSDEDDEDENSSEVSESGDENVSEEASSSGNKFKMNLRKLNQSLQNDRVSVRGRAGHRKRTENVEPLVESPDCSSGVDTSESGTSLYMLNSKSSFNNLDSADEGNSERTSAEFENSNYRTASLHVDTDNQKDEVFEDSSVDDTEDYQTAKEYSSRMSMEKKTPQLRKSLRDRYDSLRNSFSEMLTPSKKKGSMVPVPARTKVMVLCDQTEPVTFTAALTKSVLLKCKKIGEGVYGEVFRSCNNGQSVAIKIIPIEGDFLVNDEQQKKFDEILPEIVIAKELSDLRYSEICTTSNFCEVMNVSCVKGKYPACLLKQWDDYHKKKQSENDRPDVFKEDQLYIVFEFADCGTAVESYKFDELQKSRSILTQVTFALAVAEEALMFEHRDLHWGNVLVRPTEEEEITFRLGGLSYRVPTLGLEANIIDYTLSRLTKDGCKVYSDLSKDDTLFQGKGDYQFDIYRKMKDENGNDWEKFCPFTNVLWLHYLADKLVYRNTTLLRSREERDLLRQFRQFLSEMLDYNSATHMAKTSLFLNS